MLMVDDHLVVRSGLKALLGTQPDIAVVAEAATGEEALLAVGQRSPRRGDDGPRHGLRNGRHRGYQATSPRQQQAGCARLHYLRFRRRHCPGSGCRRHGLPPQRPHTGRDLCRGPGLCPGEKRSSPRPPSRPIWRTSTPSWASRPVPRRLPEPSVGKVGGRNAVGDRIGRWRFQAPACLTPGPRL